ncbi:histone PARylation factor 1 [Aplysia californica]|uniref:Histone PARylation factor 1 n=1 Tax=Aplysia californica TaxID=6500 RepID=A0ABM0JKE2_APLCA|nr:histone PARylation factor 1 [Aplysia californica]
MAAVPKQKITQTKPDCKYGSKCYRKNTQHLQNYSHPRGNDEEESSEDPPTVRTRKGNKDVKGNEKKTIRDYFGKTHDLSESDEDDDGPKTKKAKTDSSSKDVASSSSEVVETNSSKEAQENDEDVEEEDDEAPASPEDIKESIKAKFLVEMPEDFFLFWEFCKCLNPSKPQDALKKSLSLRLVGPFDVVAGRHKGVTRNKRGRRPNFLLHYRYYYDPPEFQTVIAADDDTKFHLGYYRDDPQETPVFVASNSPGQPPRDKIHQCGENLFAAVHIYASKQVKTAAANKKKDIQTLIKSIEEAAAKHKLPLEASTKQMKSRQKKVVCPTFHSAGIVVPVDDNEVGYRPVPETIGDLRAMFRKISESKGESERDKNMEDLHELITLVQFANDECDYGEGLELGLDLFSFGGKIFHSQIETLLPLAYQLLKRNEFSKIIEAHLKRRPGVTECVDELLS